MTDLELQLIPTEDLTIELNKRFDALVIIGVQMKITKEKDSFYHRCQGGFSHCLGLVEIVKSILLKDYHAGDEFNTEK